MIVIHAGTHKTGSKSLQQFLADNASYLLEAGFDLYRGNQRNPSNHIELHLAALRKERDSFARWNFPEIAEDITYYDQISKRTRSFVLNSQGKNQIFTNEDLCLLRYEDEFDRLKHLVVAETNEIKIVLFVRNKDDFLRSYTGQLLKKPGRLPSADPSSALYVEANSWVADFRALVDGYSSAFGKGNVTTIDYDREVALRGNVIPAFFDAIGIPMPPHCDPSRYFLNTSVR